ncbi:MAG: GNAT family N-acetyltransferase [Anaerolineales bacterium]|nr:GNAT family N-acetyltransferase [Anaerolineales bacterium]
MQTQLVSSSNNETAVDVLDAPAIDGLAFRRFRGEVDYAPMLKAIQASSEADGTERADTLEDIRVSYARLVNCDPYRDMLFAEVNGEVIGYNRVDWKVVVEGERIHRLTGFLHPAWRRRGIGGAMLRDAERRARRVDADLQDGRPRYFEVFAADSEIGCIALLLNHGFNPVRYSYRMVRPNLNAIPDCPLPAGLEIRPVQPEHLHAIHAASMEAFQDEWGFSPDEEPSVEQWQEDPKFDPGLWQVAWDGEQVAGMVLTFVNRSENEKFKRQRGWTENICVRRPWRKRGLARALIAASLRDLKQRGLSEAALGVDTENPSGALRLYEGMGYRPVHRLATYRKPM